ncbi:MAG: ABC-2 transporter permease [Myxococcales bacterium]|nr:ABC-2 transporter permease [Myxococcales bacterium]MCB9712663.1 ABC-2 transporter permease [Myxococcales bacterium]
MLGLDFKVVSAIFRKDMRTYLGNPTGYVFITLFIMFTGGAAFLQEEFFSRNLADLATLNSVIPVILTFFVPAITMNAMADERRGGTDELLLTLPVRDHEVVLGKYLGVLGMFTLSLLITAIAQLSVLAFLGDPDSGLMFATFAGYWLMGALFIAISLVGSTLSQNPTVAFILGAVGCLLLVLAGTVPWASGGVGILLIALACALAWYTFSQETVGTLVAGLLGLAAGSLVWQSRNFGEDAEAAADGVEAAADLSSQFESLFSHLSVSEHFDSFGEGVIRLGDVLYFAGGAVALLYLCTFLLGRRLW